MARRRATNSDSRRNGTTTQAVSHGGIKKRSPAPRVDRDGDLDMDAPAGRGRGRGGTRGRPGKNGVAPDALQKAIIRGMNSGEAVVRGPRSPRGNKKHITPLDQISVRGWKESKAASNPGGPVKSLLGFLERKASAPETQVKITKSRIQGDTLIIFVKPEDTASFVKLNTFSFAGAPLTVEKREIDPPKDAEVSNGTMELKQQLSNMLARRYSPETKILDLTAMATDTEIANTGMFEGHSSQSKFFPALMKVCDGEFKTRQQKSEMVLGVTLANNNLPNLATVTTLAQTFPDLRNLDLSNNNIQDLKDLEAWRRKFRSLDWLILTGNPIETHVPSYREEMVKWFPSLRNINDTEIRRVPAGYGEPAIGKPEEQLQKEVFILQLTRETGMTLKYSNDCMEAAGWDMEAARHAFESSKASIPPEGYLA